MTRKNCSYKYDIIWHVVVFQEVSQTKWISCNPENQNFMQKDLQNISTIDGFQLKVLVVGIWAFKLHQKRPKGCPISSCCLLGNDTKKWFLANWGRENNTQGVHEHSKFRKNFTVCWVRLWTTNKYSFMEC